MADTGRSSPWAHMPAGRLVRLALSPRGSPWFGGQAFGAAGPYEYLAGRAECEIDPQHPLNRGIVNLDSVPATADGMVSYAVDIALLKPVDPSRGNGWLFHESLNRGGKRALHRI